MPYGVSLCLSQSRTEPDPILSSVREVFVVVLVSYIYRNGDIDQLM